MLRPPHCWRGGSGRRCQSQVVGSRHLRATLVFARGWHHSSASRRSTLRREKRLATPGPPPIDSVSGHGYRYAVSRPPASSQSQYGKLTVKKKAVGGRVGCARGPRPTFTTKTTTMAPRALGGASGTHKSTLKLAKSSRIQVDNIRGRHNLQ